MDKNNTSGSNLTKFCDKWTILSMAIFMQHRLYANLNASMWGYLSLDIAASLAVSIRQVSWPWNFVNAYGCNVMKYKEDLYCFVVFMIKADRVILPHWESDY